jgi:hypothetical protein
MRAPAEAAVTRSPRRFRQTEPRSANDPGHSAAGCLPHCRRREARSLCEAAMCDADVSGPQPIRDVHPTTWSDPLVGRRGSRQAGDWTRISERLWRNGCHGRRSRDVEHPPAAVPQSEFGAPVGGSANLAPTPPRIPDRGCDRQGRGIFVPSPWARAKAKDRGRRGLDGGGVFEAPPPVSGARLGLARAYSGCTAGTAQMRISAITSPYSVSPTGVNPTRWKNTSGPPSPAS